MIDLVRRGAMLAMAVVICGGTAFADLEWLDVWVESSPSIKFESSDWAETILAEAESDGTIAIEGGRLISNTTWANDKTHLVVNTVYVPSGMTLTISAGALVNFCEGTFIKVEDGGKLNIVGTDGADVVLDGSESSDCIRLQSSAATFTDNGYVGLSGFTSGLFAAIDIKDVAAFAGGGKAIVPVYASGSRESWFALDWVAETNGVEFASGTLVWNKASDGAKNIEIPFGEEVAVLGGFIVRGMSFRGCYATKSESEVRLSEYITIPMEWSAAESEPPIRFESSDWAESILAEAESDETIAIEGGRLLSNTTWANDKTHLVVNTVYVPSGMTLTISAGAFVKFCEGTFIKVEDGGKLNIVGTDGADVVLDGTDANECIRLQSSAATFTDNGWLQTRGFDYGEYPSVGLNDTVAFRSYGVANVPVTISGTRNQSLTVDWVAVDDSARYGEDYTLAAGRITWSKASDGTKTISIPLVASHITGGLTSFKLKITAARGANIAKGECVVEIHELDMLPMEWSAAESEPPIRFESSDWAETVLAEAESDETIAIEGGRLVSGTTWTSNTTHLVVNTVYVPSGVTLTISVGAFVKFCEGTFIKVEDGGKLNIVGTDGADVVLDGAESGDCIRLQSSAATFNDNGWLQTRGFSYGAYPTVTLHGATASRTEGKIYLAVTISGSTRNQSFSVDWVSEDGSALFGRDYTNTRSGRLTWAKSGDGTKYIEVPLVVGEKAGEMREFNVRLSAVRGANVAASSATATIMEFGDCGIVGEVAFAQTETVRDFAIDEGIGRQRIFLNDVETVRYSGRWQECDNAAKVVVSIEDDNGEMVLTEAATCEEGSVELDVAGCPAGYYTLKHKLVGATGETLATLRKSFSVVDESVVDLHGGALSQNETWSAAKVHVVYETVVVPTQYTLFIEPGAVVKFIAGTGINILSGGGALFADEIIFTHIDDDTVGGDALNDGFAVAPETDAYSLSGNFTFGDNTELRYITQQTTLSGTISGAKTLSRSSTYRVSGAVTVASGGTLTIPAGTVLKMESGAKIVVSGGGTLNAKGTRAAPVIFTSIKDDRYGGDTNKDGDATLPQPGDWGCVLVSGGTINASYSRFMFGSGVDGNQYGARACVFMWNGGSGVFDSCIFSGSNMDGCFAQNATFTNCIFTDCDRGLVSHTGDITAINCVATDNRIGFFSHTSPLIVKNSISSLNAESPISGDGGSRETSHCYFGDEPRFKDAENGDYRIAAGSPCIDAGDGDVAPAKDYYGQPRVGVADIGISEFQLRGGSSDVDLAPKSISVEGNVSPGQLLTVKWEDVNHGSGIVDEPWRDTLTLVNSAGRSVALGDKTVSRSVGAGGTVSCSGNFTVPAIAEGEWFVKLNVNSYHDVFEGTLTENNAMVSAESIAVGIEATYASNGNCNGVVSAGATKVLKLAFSETDERRMVRLRLPDGVTVRYGLGVMPTDTTATGVIQTTGADAVFKVPDDVGVVYVAIESVASAEYELLFEAGNMAIESVSVNELPKSGNVTFTINGAGLDGASEVYFSGEEGGVPVDSFKVVDAQTIVATVDCDKLQIGGYTLLVSDGESAIALPRTIMVADVEGKGEFWARLVVPESVRQGRKVTCYVEYGNSGNADIPCQVVQVKMEGDGSIFIDKNRYGLKKYDFVSLGNVHPAGRIVPGETIKKSLCFIAGSSNKIELYSSSNSSVVYEPWVDADEFIEDFNSAIVIVARRGGDASDFDSVIEVAKKLHNHALSPKVFGEVKTPDGLAAGSIEVCITDSYNETISVLTGTDGRYSALIGAGSYMVGISDGMSAFCMDKNIVCDGANDVECSFTLDDGIHTDIRVDGLLETEEAVVVAISQEDYATYGSYCIAHGQYRFDNLPTNIFFAIEAQTAEKFGSLYFIPDEEDLVLDVTLNQIVQFNGQINNIEISQIAEGSVYISLKTDGFEKCLYVDEDGNFSDMIPAGEYEIAICGVNCSYRLNSKYIVDVAGSHLEFELEGAQSKLEGTIVGGTGLKVVLSQGSALAVSQHCDGDGGFTFERIADGQYFLFVYNDEDQLLMTQKIEIADNTRNLVLALPFDKQVIPEENYNVAKNKVRLVSSYGSSLEKDWFTRWFDTDIRLESYALWMEAVAYWMKVHPKLPPSEYACEFNMELYQIDYKHWNEFSKKIMAFGTLSKDCSRMQKIAVGSRIAMDAAAIIGDLAVFEGKIAQAIFDITTDSASLALSAQEIETFNDTIGCLQDVLDVISTIGIGTSLAQITDAVYILQHKMRRIGRNYSKLHYRGSKVLKYLGWLGLVGDVLNIVLDIKEYYEVDQKFDKAVDMMTLEIERFRIRFEQYKDDASHYGLYHKCDEENKWIYVPPLDERTPSVPTSIDPNEMAGPKGIAKLQYINVGDYLEYTVYFENKSDATAAAQEVYITNPLSEYLDWNSFEIGEIAFNNQVDIGLDGKSDGTSEVVLEGSDYKVRSQVSFNKAKGIINCYIRIVDESTDSTWPDDVYAGFLPPNDDTKRGEGHFTYRVKLREDAPAWETVTNTASIVFDYNDPIETDPSWWNTVLIPLSMNYVLNADNVHFANDAIAPWDMDLDESCSEDDKVSYRSGVIFDGESTKFSMLVKGPGTLSFWWKCSAEYRNEYGQCHPLDYGCLLVDGEATGVEIYGWEGDWTNRTVKILGDGQHVVSWVYRKNAEDVEDVGDDSLWIDGVAWVSDWPSILGDRDADIEKLDDGTFSIMPSAGITNLCVNVPEGVDATKVTVGVDTSVKSFSLGGANARIISGGHDITPYLTLPSADSEGRVLMDQVVVKQDIANESLDVAKGAVFDMNPESPALITAETKPGLTYTLREGVTLDDMKDGDTKVGDGTKWVPNITVRGGASGFYTIKVEK